MPDNGGKGESSPFLPEPVAVSVSFEELNDLSLGILRELHGGHISPGAREMAVAMTLGRLMASPRVLTHEEEASFISMILDFAGSYWASGRAN